MLGIEHSVAKKLRDKIHEHSIACADKLMKSRRMLAIDKVEKGLRLTPIGHLVRSPPIELLS